MRSPLRTSPELLDEIDADRSCIFWGMSAPWTPEPFEADDGSVPFESFIDDLSDFEFAALDAAIRVVLAERIREGVRRRVP